MEVELHIDGEHWGRTYKYEQPREWQQCARQVANNTWILQTGDLIIIRLHATDIITKDMRDGSVRLDTGGWPTVTTVDRLDRFTPGSIHVYRRKNRIWVKTKAETVLMHDNIIIRHDGTIDWTLVVRDRLTGRAS